MKNWAKTRQALWLTTSALSWLSLAIAPTATAAPSRFSNVETEHEVFNGVNGLPESGLPVLDLHARQDGSIPLRIMPLGASIMAGVGSTTNHGYASVSCLLLPAL